MSPDAARRVWPALRSLPPFPSPFTLGLTERRFRPEELALSIREHLLRRRM